MFYKKEDISLIYTVNDYSDSKWSLISETLTKKFQIFKTPQQCRERYTNYLNPLIDKSKWSCFEIKKLFFLQNKYGNQWTKISKELRNRSEVKTKNKFFLTIKKLLRKINKLTLNNKISNLNSKWKDFCFKAKMFISFIKLW